jgi:hypothetical protein
MLLKGKGHVMEASPKVGLEALLAPDNCVLVLIDHQPFQLANVNSHEPTMVMNNVTALAKTAKAFNVPTILTTVNEERGGLIFKTVQDVFPNQTTISKCSNGVRFSARYCSVNTSSSPRSSPAVSIR